MGKNKSTSVEVVHESSGKSKTIAVTALPTYVGRGFVVAKKARASRSTSKPAEAAPVEADQPTGADAPDDTKDVE